jgi:hypothetical protein
VGASAGARECVRAADSSVHHSYALGLPPLQPDAPKNPRAVAEALLANLPETGMVAETSLAGERASQHTHTHVPLPAAGVPACRLYIHVAACLPCPACYTAIWHGTHLSLCHPPPLPLYPLPSQAPASSTSAFLPSGWHSTSPGVHALHLLMRYCNGTALAPMHREAG